MALSAHSARTVPNLCRSKSVSSKSLGGARHRPRAVVCESSPSEARHQQPTMWSRASHSKASELILMPQKRRTSSSCKHTITQSDHKPFQMRNQAGARKPFHSLPFIEGEDRDIPGLHRGADERGKDLLHKNALSRTLDDFLHERASGFWLLASRFLRWLEAGPACWFACAGALAPANEHYSELKPCRTTPFPDARTA